MFDFWLYIERMSLMEQKLGFVNGHFFFASDHRFVRLLGTSIARLFEWKRNLHKAFLSSLSLRRNRYGPTCYSSYCVSPLSVKTETNLGVRVPEPCDLGIQILFTCSLFVVTWPLLAREPSTPTNLFQTAWQQNLFLSRGTGQQACIIFGGCTCLKHALHYLEWEGMFLNAVPLVNFARLSFKFSPLQFHSAYHLQFFHRIS